MNNRPLRISLLGSGWLGSALATHFLSAGHSISASTRTVSKLAKLESLGCTAFLIDLGTEQPFPPSFFVADILIISITSKSLIEHEKVVQMISHSAIRQVIYTSSTSVYQSSDGDVDEQSPLVEDHPLVQIERLYQGLDQPSCILRLAGLVGPDRHPGRFFRKKPTAAIARVPSNLVHLHDILPAFSWLVEHMPIEEVFNIVSDEHPPKYDVYSAAYEDYTGQSAQFVLSNTPSSRGSKRVINTKIKYRTGLTFSLKPYYSFIFS